MGFLNSLFSGLGNAFGSVGNAVGSAGKAVSGFLNPAGAAAQGGMSLGQNLVKGAQGIFSGFNKAQQPNVVQPNSYTPKFPAMAPGQGYSQLNPGQLQNSPYQHIPSSPGSVGSSSPQGSSGIQKLLGMLTQQGNQGGMNMGQIGMGLLTNLAGEAFAPKVKGVPDVNSLSSVQALQQFNPGQTKPLDPAMEAAINRSLDTEHQAQMKNLRDVYKNARPGTDYTTDSAYQRDLANLESEQALNRADAIAKANFQNLGYQQNSNQQELSKLSEIAQMDIFSIMAQTGMSAQEAQQFKQSFSNIGSMFMQKGMGMDNSSQLQNILRQFQLGAV